jgi:lipid II:glycine glycyltransferase (peptidoglycan interpeptide bridge formation enzyme)
MNDESRKHGSVPGYKVEVDKVSSAEWSDIISKFDDATIYQTWSYGAIRWGEKNLSHLVLKYNGEIVAAAQLRILQLPMLKRGIAYISEGPLWRRNGKEISLNNFKQIIKAIKEEYAINRKLLVRLNPNIIEKNCRKVHSALEAQQFQWTAGSYQTFILDLAPSQDDLRRGLKASWRRHLMQAERNNLKLMEGTNTELFLDFKFLYHQMLGIKKFVPQVDINEFHAIQADLPQHHKMRIFICYFSAEPVAAVICSMIGHTGIYLLGATGTRGRQLKLQGSYLLHWRLVEWLKARGARWYDLGGYDFASNPGTARFKAGIGGKHAQHVGQFEVCSSVLSSCLVRTGEQLRKNKRIFSKIPFLKVAIGVI